jgi:hypothetical protein
MIRRVKKQPSKSGAREQVERKKEKVIQVDTSASHLLSLRLSFVLFG